MSSSQDSYGFLLFYEQRRSCWFLSRRNPTCGNNNPSRYVPAREDDEHNGACSPRRRHAGALVIGSLTKDDLPVWEQHNPVAEKSATGNSKGGNSEHFPEVKDSVSLISDSEGNTREHLPKGRKKILNFKFRRRRQHPTRVATFTSLSTRSCPHSEQKYVSGELRTTSEHFPRSSRMESLISDAQVTRLPNAQSGCVHREAAIFFVLVYGSFERTRADVHERVRVLRIAWSRSSFSRRGLHK
uniref:Uncharacterized protein n=1 Tax=viral metagenome TaxID=1070528 RepID=A0A6C0BZR2_9ZZZZ